MNLHLMFTVLDGKGTISEVLTSVWGKPVLELYSESFNNSNSLAALIGKKIAIDPDSSGHIKSRDF